MKRGDKVADFELPDQTGTVRSLTSLLADGPIVLFFYPAAMTPGCTKEACHFRDLASEFASAGANRVGISTDGVDKQAKFAETQKFDYPLLSDSDGAVATQFGVKRGLLGKLVPVKRTTFVIDKDRTVLDVIATGALLWWAVDEIVRGVNPFRRILGAVVVVAELILLMR